jgi:hypothetical protein
VGCGIAQDIVHNPASFYTCNDRFNEDTDTGNPLILSFIFRPEFMIAGFFLRLRGRDVLRCNPLEARIFQEDTARRKWVVFFIAHAFVVDASSLWWTEVAYTTLFNIHKEIIVHRMVFFLPRYFSLCSVGSGGRWMRRSVPSMMQSTDTQSARVCARFFGALAGKARASPRAMCKTVLRVCLHSLTRPGLVSQRKASTSGRG